MPRNTNTSRKTPARTFVALKLDNDLLEKLDALAAQEDRTRSAQIRRLLQERLGATTPGRTEDATAAA